MLHRGQVAEKESRSYPPASQSHFSDAHHRMTIDTTWIYFLQQIYIYLNKGDFRAILTHVFYLSFAFLHLEPDARQAHFLKALFNFYLSLCFGSR